MSKWGTTPGDPERPPASIHTIKDCIDYYRQACKTQREVTWISCTGGDQLFSSPRKDNAATFVEHRTRKSSHVMTYALAKSVWKLHSEQSTAEAIELLWTAVEAEPLDPNSRRTFLLDLLIESGRWDSCIKLLHFFPDEWSTEWAWSAALIHIRSKGLRSKTAKAAVHSAVQCNPHVFAMMLDDQPLVEWRGLPHTHKTTRAGTHADAVAASHYLNVHWAHWKALARTVGGGYSALQAKLRRLGTEAYAEWQQLTTAEEASRPKTCSRNLDSLEKALSEASMQEFFDLRASGSDKLPGGGTFANWKLPTIAATHCAHCNAFLTVPKACKCGLASYCNTTCQKADWPFHKAPCKGTSLVGRMVELQGLSNAALNGTHARAIEYLHDQERVKVRLQDANGREVAVKYANLKAVADATGEV